MAGIVTEAELRAFRSVVEWQEEKAIKASSGKTYYEAFKDNVAYYTPESVSSLMSSSVLKW